MLLHNLLATRPESSVANHWPLSRSFVRPIRLSIAKRNHSVRQWLGADELYAALNRSDERLRDLFD